MPIIVGRDGVHGDIFQELARIEQLGADLELIACGEAPSPHRLAAAPLMSDWRVAARAVPCLVGMCGDHPRLNGPVVGTTDLWVIAPELGWARTLSRFYRLGSPHRAEVTR